MRRTTVLGSVAALVAGVALVALRGADGAAAAYRVDPGESWVVAVTEKAGIAGFLGHRHAILVTDWTADVAWRPDEPAASRARFTVPARALRIDTDRGREIAGIGEGPSADDVAELQGKMLSPENLDAASHPELRLEVIGVEPASGGGLRVTGQLTVRGRTEAVRFPVAVEEAGGGAVRFTGAFTVQQSSFGIEPESIGGVVKVADPVEVRFRVVLRPAA